MGGGHGHVVHAAVHEAVRRRVEGIQAWSGCGSAGAAAMSKVRPGEGPSAGSRQVRGRLFRIE